MYMYVLHTHSVMYVSYWGNSLFCLVVLCRIVSENRKSLHGVGKLSFSSFPNKVSYSRKVIFSWFFFYYSLSQYSDENMMDPYNLAICFGPTLMPVPDIQDQVSCQAHVNEIIKTIIIHHEAIFPDAKELDGPVYEKCMAGDDYW